MRRGAFPAAPRPARLRWFRPARLLLFPVFPVLLLFLFLAAFFPARGEVFWRLPRRTGAVLRELGGVKAYETDVRVNGSPGRLSVYAFSAAVAGEVVSRAARLLNLAAPAAGRPGGAAMLALPGPGGRGGRLLALPGPGGRDACAVLVFEPAEGASGAGAAGGPGWPEGIPALDARPVFTAECGKTRAAFAAAETAEEPGRAAAAAAERLRNEGWEEASPPGAGCRILTKGGAVCAVSASEDPATGRTVVGILRRDGAAGRAGL